jgi:predicted transcriptional regulator
MQKLDKLGWLVHRETGRSYVYRASRSRQEAGQRALRKFTDRVFGSDPLLLFQHLLRDDSLSPEDLTTLKRMIDQQRKERKDGP